MHSRRLKAVELLTSLSPKQDFTFLGEGASSVILHDYSWVYKVVLPSDMTRLPTDSLTLNVLRTNREQFLNKEFFYPLHELIDLANGAYVVVYPFEISTPCTSFDSAEIQRFLIETWQMGLVFRDVKPANFIRVASQLKWIDYDPEPITDNLFLNMATRAFLYAHYPNKDHSYIKKLRRSAINNFDLPELEGLQEFMNTLYAKIIYEESQSKFTEEAKGSRVESVAQISIEGTWSLPYQHTFNPEMAFWQLRARNLFLKNVGLDLPLLDAKNYFSPSTIVLQTAVLYPPRQPVSLVIKACIQDAEVIYEATKHIVRQLTSPNRFDEVILALDTRPSNFLREYNAKNNWQQLIVEAQRLSHDLVIDHFIFPTQDQQTQVIKKWFGLETDATHTVNKVPVATPLFAFEVAKNDYIFQIDCDAIIGRSDLEHNFLNDMITELNAKEQVLSVGFNIYHGKNTQFTPYFGYENGGFVPEVRCCLLQKSRIEKLLPLHNEIAKNNTLTTSWYRALELRQKQTETCSVRGGDSRSFFIHPQNFKKKNTDVWFTILDRVEQGEIPSAQIGGFDLAGSYYNWAGPKRNEQLIVLSCFRNISIARFLRFWYSLISQTNEEWGLILIDDASDNGISHFIKPLIAEYSSRITFVQNRYRVGVAQNTYKAIHYFMGNKDSIVCILDADDALIGKYALDKLIKEYILGGVDVAVGKMYRTDKLHAHYKYTPNFVEPRRYGGNVWQHLRSFRKYLFDSLTFKDLKIRNQYQQTDDILLARRFSHKMVFPEHCWDFTYMIPIVEMASNPVLMNGFNIYHDRTTSNTPEVKAHKEAIIAEVLAKPAKSQADIVKGRQTFLPNLHQIEIDITYECNLKCINCNRSSTQSPITGGMAFEQIEMFVRESIAMGKKWKLINLLGGEPSLHKDFLAIVDLILYEYITKHSQSSILQITSNGFGEFVQEQLDKLPHHPNLIIDRASFKDQRVVSYFSPFNDAPIDKQDGEDQEYHKGCWITAYCGIGLNQLGYYPCAVAGGIDRIFQLGLGLVSLYDVDESIARQLDTFCRYCGNFSDYADNGGNFIPRHEKAALTKPIISESWKAAYRKYNDK